MSQHVEVEFSFVSVPNLDDTNIESASPHHLNTLRTPESSTRILIPGRETRDISPTALPLPHSSYLRTSSFLSIPSRAISAPASSSSNSSISHTSS